MKPIKGGSDLNQGKVLRTLIVFSLPFMLSTLLQMLYSLVDMVVVGQVVGSGGLSAVSTGSMLMELIMVFCVGFSSAGQIIISQHVGAGKREGIYSVNGTLLTVISLLALILMTVGLCGGGSFLRLLNIPEEAEAYGQTYVRVCSTGVIFTALYNMISAVFRGMGDSSHPLLFIFIATATNLVLDILFVAVLRWEVFGAALATVIGQAVSVVSSLIFLAGHQDEFCFSFRPKYLRPNGRAAAILFRLGIPLALQSSAVMFSFLFVSSMINSLGVEVSAVFGVGQKLRNIPSMMTQAIGLGAAAMVGQAFGAGNTDRVSRIYKDGCLVNAVIIAAVSIVYIAFPTQCFRLFTPDEAVLGYASMFMFTLALEMPAKIFMPSGGALISGCGNTALSMTLALCDAFLGRVLFTWLFGSFLQMGAFGCFLGYHLATYVTAVPQVIYFCMGTWKKRKRLILE